MHKHYAWHALAPRSDQRPEALTLRGIHMTAGGCFAPDEQICSDHRDGAGPGGGRDHDLQIRLEQLLAASIDRMQHGLLVQASLSISSKNRTLQSTSRGSSASSIHRCLLWAAAGDVHRGDGAHRAMISRASACMSSATISGTGTPGACITALLERLTNALEHPAAWAPIVSQR